MGMGGWIILGVVVLVLLYLAGTYNRLVRLRALVKEGRAILDHIAGFKQYLSITEGERLDRMTPPKDTPELFEKYLPFAIEPGSSSGSGGRGSSGGGGGAGGGGGW